MSNKTIIEYGFRVMWRIMQWSWRLLPTLVFSSVDKSLPDLLNSSHHTQPQFNTVEPRFTDSRLSRTVSFEPGESRYILSKSNLFNTDTR